MHRRQLVHGRDDNDGHGVLLNDVIVVFTYLGCQCDLVGTGMSDQAAVGHDTVCGDDYFVNDAHDGEDARVGSQTDLHAGRLQFLSRHMAFEARCSFANVHLEVFALADGVLPPLGHFSVFIQTFEGGF